MLNPPTLDGAWQVDSLYFIYGAGFAATWGLYAALYAHALAKRKELELNPVELLHTRATLNETLIYVIVCMLSVVLAAATSSHAAPGFVYFLLGPLQAANGCVRPADPRGGTNIAAVARGCAHGARIVVRALRVVALVFQLAAAVDQPLALLLLENPCSREGCAACGSLHSGS